MTRLKKQEILFRGYFQANNMSLSLKAMNLALRIHRGIRKDGVTLEVAHQFEIVSYVLQIIVGRVDEKTLDIVVAACFLHDVVEDYPDQIDCEYILSEFGFEVFEIVCLVTKSSTFRLISKEKALKEYYSDMLRNVFAVIVKATDRIHNIQSMLGVFNLEKRKEYIKEVRDHIYPLLKRARKKYPEFFFVFINLTQLLEKQIWLIEKYNEMEILKNEN